MEMLHTILEGEGVAAACVYGAMDQVGLGVLGALNDGDVSRWSQRLCASCLCQQCWWP